MLRPLICATALSALLIGCSDKPVPQPAPPKPVAPVKAAPVAAPKPKPVGAVNPTKEMVFSTIEECTKAKFTPGQCSSASGVAGAMSQSVVTVYDVKVDCEKHFEECVAAKATNDKKGFYPKMQGFSLGSEKPGVERTPTYSTPIFYAPVYKNKEGKWVYILLDHRGGVRAYEVK